MLALLLGGETVKAHERAAPHVGDEIVCSAGKPAEAGSKRPRGNNGNDLTHSSLIEPYLIAALSEQSGLYRFAKEFDIRDKATNAITVPSETSWWGSANDDGAGVDTEYNAEFRLN